MAAVDLEQYKDLDRAIEQLLQCKPLSEGEVKELCAKAQNVFVNENNVQPVAAPVTVSWPAVAAALGDGSLARWLSTRQARGAEASDGSFMGAA